MVMMLTLGLEEESFLGTRPAVMSKSGNSSPHCHRFRYRCYLIRNGLGLFSRNDSSLFRSPTDGTGGV